MPKGGALKSVYIVTDENLRVNGGKWILQQGPALKVRGFTEDTIGSRKIKGGDALPVYVVAEDDLEINGGRWKVYAGEPVQVTDVIGAARGIIQGHAIPVMPVDANGDYDSDFAGAFSPLDIAGLELWVRGDGITGLNDNDPVANWPDESGNGNDFVEGVGVQQPLYKVNIVNGLPVVRFDGSDDGMTAPVSAYATQTLFKVCRKRTAPSSTGVYAMVLSNNGIFAVDTDAGSGWIYYTVVVGNLDLGGTVTNWHIFVSRFYGVNQVRHHENGGAVLQNNTVNADQGTSTTIDIGSNVLHNNPADFDFAEIIRYNAELSVDNVNLVGNYLGDKYGITWTDIS